MYSYKFWFLISNVKLIMQLKNRIILSFNRFYSNLLKDIKTTNDSNKIIIKKNYKIFDKLSPDYIEFFNTNFGSVLSTFINDDVKIIEANDEIMGKNIVKDISIKMVFDGIDENDKGIIWNYIFILTLFVCIQNEGDEDPEVEKMFNLVISVLSKIQQQDEIQEVIEESIMDDDIKKLLLKIKTFKGAEPVLKSEEEFKMPFPGMKDSMICNLAKEISNEIDVSNIKVEKPEDVLKLMDFSSGNNLVGDIIKKVSTKIHDKINTGELKQEDLFSEAMSMMSMMNMGGAGGKGGANPMDMFSGMAGMFNNPMMGEMMKAMKKGKAVPRQDMVRKASARDRLRAKLDEKNKHT